MKKLSKIFSITMVSILLLSSFQTSVIAKSTPEEIELKDLRKQSKVIDINSYEDEMRRSKSAKEQLETSKKYQKYAVSTEIVYLDKAGNILTDNIQAASTPGSTRISSYTYYGASTTYDTKSSSTLSGFSQLTLDIGMSWSHPAIGVLYTMIGRIISQDEFNSYTGIIARTLYDYKIQEKIVEVYKLDTMTSQYKWEPMVLSSMRSTGAQSNLVYYYKQQRQNPSNLDLGIVKYETGNYFYQEDRLISIAKSATYPISYPYTTGATTSYNNDYIFRY